MVQVLRIMSIDDALAETTDYELKNRKKNLGKQLKQTEVYISSDQLIEGYLCKN